MKSIVYNGLVEKKKQGKKSFAVLIDPDKVNTSVLDELIELSISAKVDLLLVGGSLVISNHLDECVKHIKKNCDMPVILFPGSPSQISKYADALLYLSLISGRNPELLIGQHVVSAPFVRQSGLEIMPTGYMVIDGGAPTTVSYISNASPIPYDKNEIAMCTAMAGEMLGTKLIYMDAGSGAKRPITESMIKIVADHIEVPLIIGGGIVQPEKDASLIKEMSDAIHSVSVKVL